MGQLRVLAWSVGLGLVVVAQATAAEPVVRYEIDVTLDPVEHRLRGTERIRWTNTGDVATSELWWHLYLNAFANERTTFMRELGEGSLRLHRFADREWGWIRFDALKLSDGTDLLPQLEFVRPDDGNPDDFTVARLTLPAEVPPGAAVELEAAFEARLPKILARTGYAGDFQMVGQWFPKLAVFEGGRGWNSHQFHAASEFYADFGSYRVTVHLPDGWVVGATGLEVERGADEDGSMRVVFAADRVHDFAGVRPPAA